MYDLDLAEEDINTLCVRLKNLIYLFKLQDLGYDIKDCLFGYCGCGNCTNELFVISTIMLIFDIEDEAKVQLEYYDFDEWAEDHPGNYSEETDVVAEIYIQDDYANKDLIPLIFSTYTGSNLLRLDTVGTGNYSAWRVAMDSWNSSDEDILDLILHIKQVCLSQEVSV